MGNRTTSARKRKLKVEATDDKFQLTDTDPQEFAPSSFQLIRQSSQCIPEKCAICFDMQSKGLLCENSKHFVCSVCVSPYVRSVIENAGKIHDDGFTIHCPVPDCKSPPWSSHQIRLILDGEVLEKYIDTLVQILKFRGEEDGSGTSENVNDKNVHQLVEALSLRCPKCKVVVDPSPDGCCALRCGSCASYFCFLCHEIRKDNKDCHDHVRNCACNPGGNVFASQSTRDTAQINLQLRSLRNILYSVYGPEWRKSPEAQRVIKRAEPILKQSNIDYDQVLRYDTVVNAPVNVREMSAKSFVLGFMAAIIFTTLYSYLYPSPSPSHGMLSRNDVIANDVNKSITDVSDGRVVGDMVRINTGYSIINWMIYVFLGIIFSSVAQVLLRNKWVSLTVLVMWRYVMVGTWKVIMFLWNILYLIVYGISFVLLAILLYNTPHIVRFFQARNRRRRN
jgi:hypothetical protein